MHFLDLEFLKGMLCIGALLGVHLVEPFLILTTSTAMTYSKLIPAFQQLYHDLLEIEPCKLLNLNKAAFTFVSDSQFTHSRYALEICRSIEAICEEYIPQVLKGNCHGKKHAFFLKLGQSTNLYITPPRVSAKIKYLFEL